MGPPLGLGPAQDPKNMRFMRNLRFLLSAKKIEGGGGLEPPPFLEVIEGGGGVRTPPLVGRRKKEGG